jgi:hypothetical protein
MIEMHYAARMVASAAWVGVAGFAPALASQATEPRLSPAEVARKIDDLHAGASGSDSQALEQDVTLLADLARWHIENVGDTQAIADFGAPPWTRQANGLHLWGVTRAGRSWFDAGHPNLVGINVSEATDIDGRYWSELARKSANGSGEKIFMIRYLHPVTRQSAFGYHTCFMLSDQVRILCAGAFEDKDG